MSSPVATSSLDSKTEVPSGRLLGRSPPRRDLELLRPPFRGSPGRVERWRRRESNPSPRPVATQTRLSSRGGWPSASGKKWTLSAAKGQPDRVLQPRAGVGDEELLSHEAPLDQVAREVQQRASPPALRARPPPALDREPGGASRRYPAITTLVHVGGKHLPERCVTSMLRASERQ
jgi:hypothetical protein